MQTKKLVTQETKPFYLTTEFWLHALAQFLLWVEAIPLEGTSHSLQVIISTVLAVGYIVSRGLAKAGTPFETIHVSAPSGATEFASKPVTQNKTAVVSPTQDQNALNQARELLSENPSVVQQLRNEGLI